MSDLLDQAKKAVILSHLSKLDRILQESESINSSFPKVIKEHLELISEDEEILGEYSMVRLTIAIAQMSYESRSALQKIVTELTLYLNQDEDKLKDAYIVDPEDEELLQLMVTTLRKLRNRSKQQLRDFLISSANGAKATLLISSDKKQLDMSHRYRLPNDIVKFFFDD